MAMLVVDLFITLDGVYQAPGAPDEDPSGGFTLGGWQAPYVHPQSGAMIRAGIDRMDAMLLGRRTYDIFAGYWPHVGDEEPIAAKFRRVPKFVASRTLSNPSWAGTTVLSNVEADVADLKGRFQEIHVIGSGVLVHTLLAAGLVDRLNLFTYPVAFGRGKRLFDDSVPPTAFRLAQEPVTFPSGSQLLVYEPVGRPVTGQRMG